MKYTLNYIKVINQLFALSFFENIRKLSRKREFNSGLCGPKSTRCQSITPSTESKSQTTWIVFEGYISHTTLYTTPASHVYHTTLWAADAASKNITSAAATWPCT